MANADFLIVASDNPAFAIHFQVPTLAGNINIVFPATGGTVLTDTSTIVVTSVKSTTTTGVVQFSGMSAGATRVITIPDANSTMARTDAAQTFYPGQIFNCVVGGAAVPTALTNCGAYFVGTSASAGYVQASVQNLTANGSSDYVVTADTGNDSTNFVSLGINNSTYSSVTWTVNGALDSYLSAVGGNLAIGTDVAGKLVAIYTGGTLAANIRAKYTDTYQSIFNKALEQRLGGVIWSKTSTTTLSSFTTSTSMLGGAGTGQGTLTLPANILQAGRRIRFMARGRQQTVSSATQYGITLTLAGVTVCSFAQIQVAGAAASQGWQILGEIVCRQTGSTATVLGNMSWMWSDNNIGSGTAWTSETIQATAVNVDTTASAAFDLQVSCSGSSASNIWTCYDCNVEVLY